MDGCTDGTWKGTRCFSCKYGRGFFCPVTVLRPDQRGYAPSRQPLPLPVAPMNISKSSAVQFGGSQNPWYGIVRWIGNLPGEQELVAGIELVSFNYSKVVNS